MEGINDRIRIPSQHLMARKRLFYVQLVTVLWRAARLQETSQLQEAIDEETEPEVNHGAQTYELRGVVSHGRGQVRVEREIQAVTQDDG